MSRPAKPPARPDYSALPAVDALLRALEGAQRREPGEGTPPAAPAHAPRSVLVAAVRAELAARRANLKQGAACPGEQALLDGIRARVEAATRPSLVPLINATGILVHTNLGRVPLAGEALAAIGATSSGYNNLEFDLAKGARGSRQAHVEGLLRELTGAPAALAVNNCAAAVLLALAALARGRTVLVSRGELVEIGGSFRMPDIMEASGARLKEVGTTNRTRLADYARAIGKDTAMLLQVHRSNFEVRGFTEEVDPAELVALGRRRGIPVACDLGSGLAADPSQFGLAPEPSLRQSLRIGFDLLFCSGDKLLGGPQAGLVLGRRAWVEALRRHPLARAVRLDKLTLAALEATLRLYRDPAEAARRIPLLRMLGATLESLERRAGKVAAALGPVLPADLAAEVRSDLCQVGGGALPSRPLESRVVAVRGPGRRLARLEQLLRAGRPPVVARVQDGALKMDLRTLSPDEDPHLIEAFGRAVALL
ncbi:MAG: L-seryl-tRNA(Sec) selenium transferase [Candidatus Eisenbacteria bacterium]|nr:L-seryl-tRNA(Sec) selenium transferase [Candidatus Eisenbacteria bacterium]